MLGNVDFSLRVIMRITKVAIAAYAVSMVWGTASAADKHLNVYADEIRRVLNENSKHIRSAEVHLADGSVVIGRLADIGDKGLTVKTKKPLGPRGTAVLQPIAYDKVITMRLDLGASCIRQIIYGVTGAMVFGGIAGLITFESKDSVRRPIGVAATAGGAILGVKLAANKRNVLQLNVTGKQEKLPR